MKAYTDINQSKKLEEILPIESADMRYHTISKYNKIWEEINKPEFDFLWNNTLGKLPRNSENWKNNHGKICPVKRLGLEFVSKSVIHDDGTRDYYSDEIVNKIMNINKKYGGIINFC